MKHKQILRLNNVWKCEVSGNSSSHSSCRDAPQSPTLACHLSVTNWRCKARWLPQKVFDKTKIENIKNIGWNVELRVISRHETETLLRNFKLRFKILFFAEWAGIVFQKRYQEFYAPFIITLPLDPLTYAVEVLLANKLWRKLELHNSEFSKSDSFSKVANPWFGSHKKYLYLNVRNITCPNIPQPSRKDRPIIGL